MYELKCAPKGTCDVGHEAEILCISGAESQSIANWYAKNIPWVKRSKVNIKEARRRLLGNIYTHSQVINLFGDGRGATVGTLLHELAHYGDLPGEDHGLNFRKNYQDLLNWWDEFHEEMLPQKFVGDIFNVLEYIMDEVSEGVQLTRKFIGEELKDEGINTLENFNFCLNFLQESGFSVK